MKLLEPVTLGDINLANRVVMAPMTRSRAAEDDSPTDLMLEYYRQRAGAGMIITEGTQPNAEGKGYCRTPGMYTDAHQAAWSAITDAVHAAGGRIVLQLMHCGRVAHGDNKAPGARTVAPSAIAAKADIFTEQGMKPCDTPGAMTAEDIQRTIADYRSAARRAVDAGFDGVELHCTSGYLPAQFLSTGTNRRQDSYGGSVENRARFALEVLSDLSEEIGPGRVGFRICPGNPFNDLQDDDPEATFRYFLTEASGLDLAYLHVIRMPHTGLDNIALARDCFGEALLLNESYTRDEAERAVRDGQGEAVSFGRPFIANPDLPRRFHRDAPLAAFDPGSLYTPGPKGYTDYPEFVADG